MTDVGYAWACQNEQYQVHNHKIPCFYPILYHPDSVNLTQLWPGLLKKPINCLFGDDAVKMEMYFEPKAVALADDD